MPGHVCNKLFWGSGCGTVDRAVASSTRDPWLNPDIGKILLSNRTVVKANIKKKGLGLAAGPS